MTNEVLNQAKDAYVQSQKEKEEIVGVMNQVVKHYKNSHEEFLLDHLEQMRKEKLKSKEAMVFDAFQSIPIEQLKSGIYVLFASYIETDSGELVLIDNPELGDWLLYYSIETEFVGKFIRPEEQSKFEAEHDVIQIDHVGTKEEVKKAYHQVRYLYFSSLLECTDYEQEKEEIIKKVQEKYDSFKEPILVKK